MEGIRLFRSRDELEGTAYFELQAGLFAGQHWAEGSVFIREDVFCLIEPVFSRHHPGFDHYAYSTIRAQAWSGMIKDLEALATGVREARSVAQLRKVGVGFHRAGADREFEEALPASAAQLAALATELAAWARHTLETHHLIWVLGM